MNDLIIYGAGGFGREIACLIRLINDETPTWNFLGYVDDGLPVGFQNRYGVVLGGVDFLNECNGDVDVIIAIANPLHRLKIAERVSNPFVHWPNLIAPDVKFFDKDTMQIGQGNILFSNCRVSCEVSIGNFNLLNSLVSLGHDVKLGDYNVVMPNTRISGESEVGNSNFFGVCSLVLQGVKIGSNTRIGASSTVIRNTKDGFLYYGNPARKVQI